ncbi:hypothetical protein N9V50_04795, partial [Flavobacteriaceae bacterium]|nr:hypothetical protein [Flavobacteriaceae bacterium]
VNTKEIKFSSLTYKGNCCFLNVYYRFICLNWWQRVRVCLVACLGNQFSKQKRTRENSEGIFQVG